MELLGVKVYLEIFVKTIDDWRNKEAVLKDLGLDEWELDHYNNGDINWIKQCGNYFL